MVEVKQIYLNKIVIPVEHDRRFLLSSCYFLNLIKYLNILERSDMDTSSDTLITFFNSPRYRMRVEATCDKCMRVSLRCLN